MLNIGSRSSPSVINLVLIVIVIFAVADYVLVSLDNQDWSWFSHRFVETLNEVSVQGRGNTIHLDQGSNHFSALATIMYEILSHQILYDSLSR